MERHRVWISFRSFIANLIDRYQLNTIFKLLIYLVLIWIIGSTWLYFTEKDYKLTQTEIARGEVNYFDSFVGSFRNNIIYIFSGFEDYVPHTTAGWFGSIFVMLFGSLGVMALLIGNVTTIIQEGTRRAQFVRRKPTYGKFHHHIVICNWSKKVYEIINQLHDPVLTEQKPIVIVSESADQIPIKYTNVPLSRFKNVYYIKGDPTSTEILLLAGIERAKTAIILADERLGIRKYSGMLDNTSNDSTDRLFASSDPTDVKNRRKLIDAKSILIGMVAESINPEVHTAVELVDSHSRIHFERTRIDEIICADTIASKLIAQCATTNGLSEFYVRLLTATQDSNEIYFVKVNGGLIDKTFRQVQKIVLERKLDTILIGFVTKRKKETLDRHGKQVDERVVVINPKSKENMNSNFNRNYVLGKNDYLIAIAYEKPSNPNFFLTD